MSACLSPVGKGRRVVLDKPVTFIGRHPDCDAVLSRSKKVSRKHCCIAQVDGTYVLRDLGSLNGIRVNGKRIKKEKRLQIGDEVAIGDAEYVMEAQADGARQENANGKRKLSQKKRPRGKHKVDVDRSDDSRVPADDPSGGPPDRDLPESIPLASLDDDDDVDDSSADFDGFADVSDGGVSLEDSAELEDVDSEDGLLPL